MATPVKLYDPTNEFGDVESVLSDATAIIAQSLAFGVYLILLPISIHLFLKRNPKTRPTGLLFCVIFMFVASTLFWAARAAFFYIRIKATLLVFDAETATLAFIWASLPNSLILVNYVLADGVVVWRAWVICKDEYRKTLMVPIFFLFCTALCVLGINGIRFSLCIIETVNGNTSSPVIDRLTRAIDVTQVANLAWTLITNLAATSIIAHKAWKYRQLIKDNLRGANDRQTQVERVFILMVESGLLYFVSQVTVLVATVIRISPTFGTLGDVYTPVNVQIAGMYPTIVLTLISLQRGMDGTTFIDSSMGTNADLEFHHSDGCTPRTGSRSRTQTSNRNVRRGDTGAYRLELRSFGTLGPFKDHDVLDIS